MPYLIISLLVKLAMVVHIVKTGRNMAWIWVVVIIPIIGPLAYFIVEIWPEWNESRTARGAKKVVGNAISPNNSLKQAARNYEALDTVNNSAELAEECLGKGLFDEAKKLYEGCLQGVHKDDPDLMYGLAQAEFGLKHYGEARAVLAEMVEKNPGYKKPEARLLFARALEEIDETELALREYEALEGTFPGPESSYRHSMLLKKLGDLEESDRLITEIVKNARISSRHYRSTHKVWIRMATDEMFQREADQREQDGGRPERN